MTPVHAKRLLKLAAFLERLPKERFNFGVYVGQDWKGAQDLSCGTVACAMGWAATMPAFRRLGLHIAFNEVKRPVPCLRGSYMASPAEAGQVLFGLAYWDFSVLFHPDSSVGYGPNAGPKLVAKRIRKYVAERSAP